MTTARSLTTARNSVGLTFALNGLFFATLFTRMPDIRSGLDLSNSALGLLLFVGSVGTMLTLPFSGKITERFGPAATCRTSALVDALAVVLVAVAVTVLHSVPLAAAGLFCYGVGTSTWDVAMNVEGAEVERRLGRTIMPRFHAAWSVGSIAGSGIGVLTAALRAPMLLHSLVVLVPGCIAAVVVSRSMLRPAERDEPDRRRSPRASAWREPRTLAIGVMVLAFALVEGTANDWLTLAVIDGYDAPHWVGVLGFSLFVGAMTAGRLLGPGALDRLGRAPVLWACTAAAAAGTLLTVFGGHFAVACVGIVVWGLGASLGFPVGMSAAADEPARAAARVSVVATIGYGAFFVGPPLLGALGDEVGTLRALVVVAIMMVPAAVSVLAARPQRS